MKLLFFINQFYKGGAETNLLNLLSALDPQRYEVDLLVYDQLKLPDVVSLLPLVPDWVHICDAADRENHIAFVKKACHKVVRKLTKHQLYRRACYEFVSGKHYDVAISYGEWFSPEFVATVVHADRKIVWIHSDIDKAQFFNGELMFKYDHEIHQYWFVSQRSMEGALNAYPQIQGRTSIVHNMCNDALVRSEAQKLAPKSKELKRPLLLTVANFREEKNHLRQVEAMAVLKRRGVDFTWLNVGSDTDLVLIAKIDAAIKKYGLEGQFIRMPAEKSPYRYMKAADAVAVLSNFESWSLVITESKLIGTPVIATRTSGALEQIEDGVTGLLCDFDVQDIADKVGKILTDKALRCSIHDNLKGFSTQASVLEEFELAIKECGSKKRTKLLYVSDNINYVSGVQKVTAAQADALRGKLDISIFSMTPPDERSVQLFKGIPIYDMQECGNVTCLEISAKEVLLGRRFTLRQKGVRLFYGIARKMGKGDWAIGLLTGKKLQRFFEGYDTVCVLSEGSQMRERVARLSHPKKIQWIHTDYALWSQYSDWTKMITKNDGDLYRAYDRIVCLTNTSRNGFVKMYPHLKGRTDVISNLQPADMVIQKAQIPLDVQGFDKREFNIVTVGRMDTEKAVDRILRVCKRLKEEGFRFKWYIAGGGPKLEEWERLSCSLDMEDYVRFLGALDNPYPLIKAADIFALLSLYEGLPVTIEEAKILHIPVIATKVGGIIEQVKDGGNGKLVENDEEEIYQGLKTILSNPELVKGYRECLAGYEFCRDEIIGQLIEVFERKVSV